MKRVARTRTAILKIDNVREAMTKIKIERKIKTGEIETVRKGKADKGIEVEVMKKIGGNKRNRLDKLNRANANKL